MSEFIPSGEGVLPAQWLHKAKTTGVIHSAFTIPDDRVQPASLDLRLGETAYRLRCSFLPEDQTVDDKLANLQMEQFDLIHGAILERGRPYLIPLMEELRLPPGIRARANPRSSIGRLDIFTRVITDRSHQFDEIAPNYEGRLFLEVVSRTFTVKVARGMALNQLRLISGSARSTDDDLLDFHERSPLLFEDAEPVPKERLALSNGLFLSLDLSGDARGFVGYRAKKNSRLLDLSSTDHDPEDFWEPIHAERGGRVILEPEEFYLLISKEAVRIPPEFAAEMNAYEPTSGELRTHYAGFFDPGFGYTADGSVRGTKAVLEVRAHDVPFMVEHGQRVCKLGFEKMIEPPNVLYGQDIGSSYQEQMQLLSKYFKKT